MTNDLAEIAMYMTKHPERGPRLFVKAKKPRFSASRSVTLKEAVAVWRGEFPESLGDMMTEAQFRGYQPDFAFQAEMWFQHLGAEIDLNQ